MQLRNTIRRFVFEALGDQRFESGAMTYGADQLIMFAENDKLVYDFAMKNPHDKAAIFNFVLKEYEKRFGKLDDDRETMMYDFMANYDIPA